jgi:hypothetical protein
MARPKKVIDYVLVDKLAKVQCTHEEIAAILDVSVSHLEHDKQFLQVYKQARESGKSSLRRAQWKAALGGNATMLIWLGKQELKQRDKTEMEHQGEINLTVKWADG